MLLIFAIRQPFHGKSAELFCGKGKTGLDYTYMNHKRKLIGVLINNLDTEYQRAIWIGIKESAREHDINVLFLGGGTIGSSNPEDARRNSLCDFILPETFDGLIIVSTTITGSLGFQGVIDALAPVWDKIPVVNIGPAWMGIPSVSANNTTGIREIVTHLVEVHGKKQFVFISGSIKNNDSIVRQESFIETLNGFGLQPVEDGILEGGFMYTNTRNVLDSWLERKIPFDAIVAASDSMAFACIDLLTQKGIKVPEDVAVTGFDDCTDACFFSPPLTTVRQPVKEIAREATHQLHRIIERQSVVETILIPTTLAIRQSCGCLSLEAQHAACPERAEISDQNERLLEQMFERVRKGEMSSSAFIGKFLEVLRMPNLSPSYLTILGNLVSRLERSLWSQSGVKADVFPAFGEYELLLHQVRILLKQQAESIQANKRIAFFSKNHYLQYSVASLIGSFSLEKLLRIMPSTLQNSGVVSGFLSFFVPETQYKRSRLVIGFYEGKNVIPPEGIEFETKDFFPRNLIPADKQFDFFVEMLFHEDSLLGVLVVNIDSKDGFVTNSLMSQIRSSLRSSMLMDELREKDKRLNAAFTQLQKRADELEEANRTIKQNQQQLVLSEKMASLGRLTAGMAHEMNTPLATAMASMSEVENLVKEYRASVGDSDVTREDHLAIADEMAKMLDLSHRSVERAAGFIRSIKNQTRTGAEGEIGVTFDFGKMVNDTVVLLGHAIRRGNCKVEIKEPEHSVMIRGRPDKLAQVITNLAINAVDAMSPKGGTLGIDISVRDNAVVLSVSDTGCGIESENLQRIFEPFYTTKPYGVGTGLGLTIVHDIIKGECQGTIDVKSTPGTGTCFTIILPLMKE